MSNLFFSEKLTISKRFFISNQVAKGKEGRKEARKKERKKERKEGRKEGGKVSK